MRAPAIFADAHRRKNAETAPKRRRAASAPPAPRPAGEENPPPSQGPGVCLGPDPSSPCGDNTGRPRRSGVTAIVQPGGSIRDQQVIDTCNKYGIAMAFCGLRLFHH